MRYTRERSAARRATHAKGARQRERRAITRANNTRDTRERLAMTRAKQHRGTRTIRADRLAKLINKQHD
jgi:hypothetical protein